MKNSTLTAVPIVLFFNPLTKTYFEVKKGDSEFTNSFIVESFQD